jgi:hypothetical protein
MPAIKMPDLSRVLFLPMIFLAMLSGCDVGHLVDEGGAGGNATASESFSFEVQVARQNRLTLRGLNGNIDLAGVPEAQAVQIWGERRVTSRSTADARAYLNNLQELHDEIRKIIGSDLVGITKAVHVPAMVSIPLRGQYITRQVSLVGVDEETYADVSDFRQYLLHPDNREKVSFLLKEGGYGAPGHEMPPSGWRYRRTTPWRSATAPTTSR